MDNLSTEHPELIRVRINMELEWKYAMGKYFGKFYRQFAEGNIVGVKCPTCDRVYLPPRPVCGNCYREMTEWVTVNDEGFIRAYTMVYLAITDPVTGQPRKTPYGMALIQLDGAGTMLNHYVGSVDLEANLLGKRVKAVYREERRGLISDIAYFRVLEG